MSAPGRDSSEQRYGPAFQRLSRILYAHDPIGINFGDNTDEYDPEARTILTGLKRYGMFVADNGIEWAISVAPDPRISNLHAELRKVKGSDFEVVVPPK